MSVGFLVVKTVLSLVAICCLVFSARCEYYLYVQCLSGVGRLSHLSGASVVSSNNGLSNGLRYFSQLLGLVSPFM